MSEGELLTGDGVTQGIMRIPIHRYMTDGTRIGHVDMRVGALIRQL
jgi:hypothetical protein